MPRPIRASISSGALAHNLGVARVHAGGAKVWAVVKANAYGHGLLRAARALRAADGFALLDIEDAVRLREAGVTQPILLLEGLFQAADLEPACRLRLTAVVHNSEQIELLRARPLQGELDVCLKVNSGLNRLGFAGDQVRSAWQALRALPGVRQITLMTHFADADGAGGVAAQLACFAELTQHLQAPRTLANSAALLRYPEARGDWVRPGIMLYGGSPFAELSAAALQLRPSMTLSAEIIAVQRLRAGDQVGYGATFCAEAEMTIGVVACGYADGYPRHAPTGTPVLVAGQRTRTVGRVAMDMLCVDLGPIQGAQLGAPVTLWGEGLAADEVAACAQTLSYQLYCALAARVPIIEVA